MIMKKRSPIRHSIPFIFLLLTLFPRNGHAQVGKQESPIIREDDSVVFQYSDSTAKSVKLYCDCRLRRETEIVKKENYQSVKMKKDSNGIWTYTTPPMASEVYTYMFEADGIKHTDPRNGDSVRVRTDKMNVFIIAKTPQTSLYVTEKLHGHLDTLVFQGEPGTKPRNILIYTPPQYTQNPKMEFPVLYLLHGLNGNETSWNDRGRAMQILDNLIIMGKASPMILVMPDANPECLIAQKENIGLFKNLMLFPTWDKLEFEHCFPAMDKFLCENYRISSKEGSRAVAGLSAGAKQAANLANMYDSTFSAVGLFSPVVGRKQLPHDGFSKYWIGGGAGDLFHHRINKFRKKMQRFHNPYTMYNSVGGHTWRNWRVYYTEFVQTLFLNPSF